MFSVCVCVRKRERALAPAQYNVQCVCVRACVLACALTPAQYNVQCACVRACVCTYPCPVQCSVCVCACVLTCALTPAQYNVQCVCVRACLRVHLPLPSWTNPVTMMRMRAIILAYVKMSWTRVAHVTSMQFTKVSTTVTHTHTQKK